ncbi:hypothetical protein [Nocardia asiatica]|nr:hypothetical protein [Nocardia asiatica]
MISIEALERRVKEAAESVRLARYELDCAQKESAAALDALQKALDG